MGCGTSRQLDEEEQQLVDKFLYFAEEEEGWEDCSRARDGPYGTKVEQKTLNGQTYWRGTASFRGPIDLVLWFLSNQSEFNAITDVDKQVLDAPIAALHARNKTKVVKMKKKNGTSILEWNVQMPSPVAPRTFVVKERNIPLAGGRHLLVSQSVARERVARPKSTLADIELEKSALGSTMSSSGPTSSTNSSGQSRPKSRIPSFRPPSLKARPKSHQLSGVLANVPSMLRPKSSPKTETALDNFNPVVHSLLGRPQAARRGKVLVSGFLLTSEANKSRTKVQFVTCVDPLLSDEDFESILLQHENHLGNDDLTPGELIKEKEALIKTILGPARVLTSVESARRYFEDPKSMWTQHLFRLASAEVGEFGFQEMEKRRQGEDKMQTGTHVQHKLHGHGIIRQFDLHGKAHVKFDSGKELVFSQEQVSRELSAPIEVGTRVVHRERGEGTVKQFDESRIHVKFDNGEYHRYSMESFREKMRLIGLASSNVKMAKCRQIDLDGITSGNLKLSAGVSAPRLELRRKRTLSLTKLKKKKEPKRVIDAEVLRISFVIAAPTELVLDYVRTYQEDEKAGNVLEDEILEEHSGRHHTRYQRIKYPQDLNDRDMVFDTCWSEVDKNTFVVVSKSTETPLRPPVPGVVRGNLVIRGYLLEPLYDSQRISSGHLFTRVTYLTCVEPGGFVPPKVVENLNRTELLGVVTDMRAYFHNLESSSAPLPKPNKVWSEFAKDKSMRRSFRRESTMEYR